MSMMEPPIEVMLEEIGHGKYELITLASKRARDINAYYNQLGAGTRGYIPPQVMSQGKPLSIAFEEITAGKLVPEVPDSKAAVEPVAAEAESDAQE